MGESEKYGIKELEEIMIFGLVAGKEGFAAFGDGFDFSDVFKLLPVFQLAPAAILGAGHALVELTDLSDAEVDHLVAKVQELVAGFPAPKAKKVALKALQLGLVAVQLWNELQAE